MLVVTTGGADWDCVRYEKQKSSSARHRVFFLHSPTRSLVRCFTSQKPGLDGGERGEGKVAHDSIHLTSHFYWLPVTDRPTDQQTTKYPNKWLHHANVKPTMSSPIEGTVGHRKKILFAVQLKKLYETVRNSTQVQVT